MRARKKSTYPKITKDNFQVAVKGTYGNLTAIASRLHVSRTTVYAFLENNADMKALLEETKESFDDIAESILQKKIIEGDTRMLEFYARTKMKHRGYHESIDVNMGETPEFKVTFSDGSDDGN
ncbi:MAG: hypothetical protein A2017_18265 [Lentisphaerae bacterium GWF2_44_16]|nr:MAG: hypothetical protein A2017_18265 [Lentisphaerae bacterium GWF2_44_16]